MPKTTPITTYPSEPTRDGRPRPCTAEAGQEDTCRNCKQAWAECGSKYCTECLDDDL